MRAFAIPEPLPPAGLAVPVDEVSSSFRVLGLLPGYSRNSVHPRLVLHPTQWEVRVVGTSYHEYTALRQIDYRPAGWLRGERVVLHCAGGGPEYVVLPASPAVCRALLGFCARRGLPLTPAARAAAAD